MLTGIKELATQASEFDAKSIAALLDQTYRAASNAKLALDSLKSHLVTAQLSPERVSEELAKLEERVQKEIRTHQSSMLQLDQLKQRWSQSPEDARQQIAEARVAAVEAAKLYKAVDMVAKLHNVGTAIANGAEFAELLGE